MKHPKAVCEGKQKSGGNGNIDVTKGRSGLERSDGEDDEFMICRNTREVHTLEDGLIT